jgi:hypothetical protein
MSTNPGSKIILDEVVSAYSHCPRKAYLLYCTEERDTPQEYQDILEERARVTRARYLVSLRQANASIGSYNDRGITSGMDIVTEANLEAGDVGAYCDVLTKVGSTRRTSAYEPTLVVGTSRVQKEQVINLTVAGYVLGQLQGKPPAGQKTRPGRCPEPEIMALRTLMINQARDLDGKLPIVEVFC